jgi:hypothetical protein
VSYGLSAKLLAETLPLGRPLHATTRKWPRQLSLRPGGACSTVLRLLTRLADARPLLLVLEDLHWASLSLFRFLARGLVGHPLCTAGRLSERRARRAARGARATPPFV